MIRHRRKHVGKNMQRLAFYGREAEYCRYLFDEEMYECGECEV